MWVLTNMREIRKHIHLGRQEKHRRSFFHLRWVGRSGMKTISECALTVRGEARVENVIGSVAET